MSASQRPGLGFVHIERKPIPFIIISMSVKTNVCNTETAAATSCWTPSAWLMVEGGEDVISWITALLPPVPC